MTTVCCGLATATATGSHNNSEDCTDKTGCPRDHCPCWSTGRWCVRSCYGMPNGDYQSCICCHGAYAYVSCVGGYLYYRPCPANLVWADDQKICNYYSRTCRECAIPVCADYYTILIYKSAVFISYSHKTWKTAKNKNKSAPPKYTSLLSNGLSPLLFPALIAVCQVSERAHGSHHAA